MRCFSQIVKPGRWGYCWNPAFISSCFFVSGDSASFLSKLEAKPSMRITKKYEHLVYFGSHNMQAVGIKSNSSSKSIDNKDNKNSSIPTVVAVEVKPQFLESQLPPSVRRKKFGAM